MKNLTFIFLLVSVNIALAGFECNKDSFYLKNALTVKVGLTYINSYSEKYIIRQFGDKESYYPILTVDNRKVKPSYGMNLLWTRNTNQYFGFELGIRYLSSQNEYRSIDDNGYYTKDTTQKAYDYYKYIRITNVLVRQNMIGLDWGLRVGDKIKFRCGFSPAFSLLQFSSRKAVMTRNGAIVSKMTPFWYGNSGRSYPNDSIVEYIDEETTDPLLPNNGSVGLIAISANIGLEKNFRLDKFYITTGVEGIASMGATVLNGFKYGLFVRPNAFGLQAYVGFSIGELKKRKLYSFN